MKCFKILVPEPNTAYILSPWIIVATIFPPVYMSLACELFPPFLVSPLLMHKPNKSPSYDLYWQFHLSSSVIDLISKRFEAAKKILTLNCRHWQSIIISQRELHHISHEFSFFSARNENRFRCNK